MDVRDLLIEVFGRIPEHVHNAVVGLDADDLTKTVVDGTNPIGWLVWHLARVQDSQLAEAVGGEQVWTTGDWPARFGLEKDSRNTGYGHRPADVARVRPDSGAALVDYYNAVAARTKEVLETLTPEDLDRVIDEGWDPPVTLGVRLISIADDDIQHAGQAKYLRGLLERSAGGAAWSPSRSR